MPCVPTNIEITFVMIGQSRIPYGVMTNKFSDVNKGTRVFLTKNSTNEFAFNKRNFDGAR